MQRNLRELTIAHTVWSKIVGTAQRRLTPQTLMLKDAQRTVALTVSRNPLNAKPVGLSSRFAGRAVWSAGMVNLYVSYAMRLWKRLCQKVGRTICDCIDAIVAQRERPRSHCVLLTVSSRETDFFLPARGAGSTKHPLTSFFRPRSGRINSLVAGSPPQSNQVNRHVVA